MKESKGKAVLGIVFNVLFIAAYAVCTKSHAMALAGRVKGLIGDDEDEE
jgi:hypothetical protein